jgi:hypothetical protein
MYRHMITTAKQPGTKRTNNDNDDSGYDRHDDDDGVGRGSVEGRRSIIPERDDRFHRESGPGGTGQIHRRVERGESPNPTLVAARRGSLTPMPWQVAVNSKLLVEGDVVGCDARVRTSIHTCTPTYMHAYVMNCSGETNTNRVVVARGVGVVCFLAVILAGVTIMM